MNKKDSTLITEKMTLEEVGAVVCDTLRSHGIDVVLTGGAVVSIYTENEYESLDLDFVKLTFSKKVDQVMHELGFSNDKSRHYIHPHTKIFVEFPGSVLAIGNQPIDEWARRKTKYGTLALLAPTECVMDRLASYYHWNDYQGLEQAIMVAKRHPIKIDKIHKWSINEGMLKKFEIFQKQLAIDNK